MYNNTYKNTYKSVRQIFIAFSLANSIVPQILTKIKFSRVSNFQVCQVFYLQEMRRPVPVHTYPVPYPIRKHPRAFCA